MTGSQKHLSGLMSMEKTKMTREYFYLDDPFILEDEELEKEAELLEEDPDDEEDDDLI